jgi:thiamine-monophosphate kinase
MELRQLGEWGLIHRIQKSFSSPTRSGLVLGMGDDAAVIRLSPGKLLLLTTDLLVEDIDFDLAFSSYDQIGYKALAANLSDIAAMGGLARYFLVSLALPSSAPVSAVDQIYRGMRRLAKKFDVALIGGDTSASRRGIFLNLAVVGEVENSKLVRRTGARIGDRIFVTGSLGDSKMGFEILKSQAAKRSPRNAQHAALIQRHLYPMPRLSEGQLIASKGLATAMMDLSDGLASDLRRLCESSRVGAVIDLASLPVSSSLARYAHLRRKDPLEYALAGGEDFELLFTVPSARAKKLLQLQQRGQIRVTQIGQILPGREGLMIMTKEGRMKTLRAKGYEHFRT